MGVMIFKNQQQFIKELEAIGELKRITKEVDPNLEITQIADRVYSLLHIFFNTGLTPGHNISTH